MLCKFTGDEARLLMRAVNNYAMRAQALGPVTDELRQLMQFHQDFASAYLSWHHTGPTVQWRLELNDHQQKLTEQAIKEYVAALSTVPGVSSEEITVASFAQQKLTTGGPPDPPDRPEPDQD
jgi:hypothetical protein